MKNKNEEKIIYDWFTYQFQRSYYPIESTKNEYFEEFFKWREHQVKYDTNDFDKFKVLVNDHLERYKDNEHAVSEQRLKSSLVLGVISSVSIILAIAEWNRLIITSICSIVIVYLSTNPDLKNMFQRDNRQRLLGSTILYFIMIGFIVWKSEEESGAVWIGLMVVLSIVLLFTTRSFLGD